MFVLISVTRDELSINENFCATKQEAVDAMVEDILLMTNYDSLEEIIKASENDEAGFSDNEAWAETKQFGTGQWKIVEIPGVVEDADGMPAKIQPSGTSSSKKKKGKVGEPRTIQRLFVGAVFGMRISNRDVQCRRNRT